MHTIRRVAVLGAGTMGSRIAAHLANAGIPSLMLDIVQPGEPDRNTAARNGLDMAARSMPAGFFTSAREILVNLGNFEDDLEEIRSCDWIIEAVAEDLDIKREIWRKAEAFTKPDAILSTCTSGIPLAKISEGFSAEFIGRFLGTHFFNPPRYMHLVEILPGPSTDLEIIQFISEFCDRRLGKGIIQCLNTPSFIANRIGGFFLSTAHAITEEGEYSIEEVEVLTGPLVGLPNSASYRLMDIIGLDVWASMLGSLHETSPDDVWRARFSPPGFVSQMIERGWLGEKTGQGFYRCTSEGGGGVIEVLDWQTLEYHPGKRPQFASVENANNIEELPSRLKYLMRADDRAGTFLWSLFSDMFLYSAGNVPEISDRIVEIDRAMKWGFGHALGPFEMWDLLGFEDTARRMEKEGRPIPPTVDAMLTAGAASFYRAADTGGQPGTEYFDFLGQQFRQIEARSGILVLDDIKRARGVVKQNDGASLVDLGDGVLCVEFHSKMNTLSKDAVSMILAGIDETSRNFKAMVIANQGSNFCTGATLMLFLLAAQEGEWDEIDSAVRGFQEAAMAIRRALKPVITAPFGRTLGVGCELCLHAARIQASSELCMGIQEVNIGLIPAAGGHMQVLHSIGHLQQAYELIVYAEVSSSAAEAREMGLLCPSDSVSMNQERLVADAKALALFLASNYVPVVERDNIPVAGESGYADLKLRAWMAREAEYITDYDLIVAEKVAYVLSGRTPD